MEATDLRIGNTVIFEDLECSVYVIRKNNEVELTVDGLDISCHVSQLRGASITENWLLQSFEKQNKNIYHISTKTHTYFFDIEKNRFYNVDGFAFDIAHNVLYKHQLQNIFHSLSGIEL